MERQGSASLNEDGSVEFKGEKRKFRGKCELESEHSHIKVNIIW